MREEEEGVTGHLGDSVVLHHHRRHHLGSGGLCGPVNHSQRTDALG